MATRFYFLSISLANFARLSPFSENSIQAITSSNGKVSAMTSGRPLKRKRGITFKLMSATARKTST